MTWARLDDEILDNKKIAKTCVMGFGLHAAAITWCCRNLTDGFIPSSRVRSLLDFRDYGVGALDVAEELVAVGLWEKAEDGFVVHDFLHYNPSKKDVLSRRKVESKRINTKRTQTVATNKQPTVERLVPSCTHPVPVPVPVTTERESAPPAAPPSKVRKVRNRKPETRIPDDAGINAWFETWGFDDKVQAHTEFSKFMNHHLSKDNAFADWRRAWMKWLGNAPQFAAIGPRSSFYQNSTPEVRPAPYHRLNGGYVPTRDERETNQTEHVSSLLVALNGVSAK